MVTADDLAEILDILDAEGLTVWIEGGWGVDALLGEETRAHDDLDAAIDAMNLDRAAAALADLGFAHDESQSQWRPARYVLRDGRNRQIDLHPLQFATDGSAVQRPPDWLDEKDAVYDAEFFTGTGSVSGRAVHCKSPAGQICHHDFPDPDDVDWADVRALCERFGTTPPAAYGPAPPGFVDPRRAR